jgi:hypothetical protein
VTTLELTINARCDGCSSATIEKKSLAAERDMDPGHRGTYDAGHAQSATSLAGYANAIRLYILDYNLATGIH